MNLANACNNNKVIYISVNQFKYVASHYTFTNGHDITDAGKQEVVVFRGEHTRINPCRSSSAFCHHEGECIARYGGAEYVLEKLGS